MMFIAFFLALIAIPLAKYVFWIGHKVYPRDEDMNKGNLTIGWAIISVLLALIPVINMIIFMMSLAFCVIMTIAWIYESNDTIFDRDLW